MCFCFYVFFFCSLPILWRAPRNAPPYLTKGYGLPEFVLSLLLIGLALPERTCKLLRGLNAIRLGVMWPGVEPVRGKYDPQLVADSTAIGDTSDTRKCSLSVPL